MAIADLVKASAARAASAAETAKLAAAAASYRSHCNERRNKLLIEVRLKKITTWDGLGIAEIPPNVRASSFTFLTVSSFLELWVLSSGERFKQQELARQAQLAGTSVQYQKAETSAGVRQVGRFRLRPRQWKSVDSIVDVCVNKHTSSAVILPLGGGEGKSVICGAVMKHAQDNNFYGKPGGRLPINRMLFLTDGTVSIDIRERLKECGIEGVGRYVEVIPHSQLATRKMAPFFVEREEEHFGQKRKRLEYILPGPPVLIIDEFDRYKKPTSRKSKYLRALIERTLADGGIVVWASATPAVTLMDLWGFAVSTGRTFNGEPITVDNYGTVAKAIAARAGVSPNENSPAAMAEFRKEFADCYINPPKDKQTAKATNKLMVLQFQSEADRKFYRETEERYLEELERCGEDDTAINPMSLLTKYRAAVEWLKAPYFAREFVKAHAEGFAPAIGVAYHATLCEIVRLLVNEHGFKRDSISVIHGGIELITEQKLIALIGKDKFDNMGKLVVKYFKARSELTPPEQTAVRKYLKWVKERAKFGESQASQRMRQDELLKLRLGPQDLASRHVEKENFLRGRTTGMVFTLSAGGRGIDMDQQFPEVRPRRGFFTPVYYAEEFLQAFYRLCRLPTLNDVDQFVLAFEHTIELDHVIPRLFKKIRAVQRGTAIADDIADEFIQVAKNYRHLHEPAEAPPTDVVIDDASGADDALAELEAELATDDDDDSDDSK